MKRNNQVISLFICHALLAACGSDQESGLKIVGGQVSPNQENLKGVFPATIGFITEGGDSKCTGTRIDQNLYLTAAHCFESANSGQKLLVKASNAQPFEVKIVDLRLAAGKTKTSKDWSDVATFGLQFITTEQKFIFDSLVEIGKVNYTAPVLGQTVSLAGFGCEEDFSVSGFMDKCLKSTDFAYMKTAKSEISGLNTGVVFEGNQLYFRLPIPAVFTDKSNGYISSGDSGGPVYNILGEVIGTNTAVIGVSIMATSLGTSFHSWLGHPANRNFIEEGRALTTSLYQITSKGYTFKNGDRYIGEFREGLPNGTGVMHYADGKRYEGSWSAGVRHGSGSQQWNPGATMISYNGNWANDRPNGQGTLVFTSGQTYTGNLVDGKMHGQGKMTYADGDLREGTFNFSKREGQFLLTKADGTRHVQVFAADVLKSSEKIDN